MNFGALDHDRFMREALREAELAGLAGELPIGAVMVHAGQIVGRDHARLQERQSKLAHAEMNVFYATQQYLPAHYRECVLYTTLVVSNCLWMALVYDQRPHSIIPG